MSEATDTIEKRERSGMGIGTKVILVLAALTVIEYLIAASEPPGQLPLILLTAIGKAVLIAIYFMHVGQIWNREQR